jgi:hypothetical protein
MSRKLIEFVSGLTVFLVLWAGAFGSIRFHLLFPHQVLIWLSQSPNPQQAVVSFSALVGSSALGLVRLGIEIPQLKLFFSVERIRKYFTGLPFWTIGIIFAFSLTGLLVVFPSCQPPASVLFNIGENTLRPTDTLIVHPGDTVSISVQPMQKDVILSCQWQYAGDAFEMLGTSNGCDIIVQFSRHPGDGYLTLQASQDFCGQSTVFPLRVQVETP